MCACVCARSIIESSTAAGAACVWCLRLRKLASDFMPPTPKCSRGSDESEEGVNERARGAAGAFPSEGADKRSRAAAHALAVSLSLSLSRPRLGLAVRLSLVSNSTRRGRPPLQFLRLWPGRVCECSAPIADSSSSSSSSCSIW
ncbi:hypothetical protein DAI22_03g203833 [Oryza sativa Japonica Group]|nr:hypothetical protein DAI22_03g203833 [Oryza sativa Japonica Group]